MRRDILEFYSFWTWQYYFRNVNLKECSFDFPNKNLFKTESTNSSHAQWSKGAMYLYIDSGDKFSSARIMNESFSGRLNYDTPRVTQKLYDGILFNEMTTDQIDSMALNKRGHIPIDFSKDIELIVRELKLFYYAEIARNPLFDYGFKTSADFYKRQKILGRKTEDAYNDLADLKIKKLASIKRFKETQFNVSRAVGLFLWDVVRHDEFRRKSLKKAIDSFSKSMPTSDKKDGENQFNKHAYADDVTLRTLFEQTHLQIITREFKLMKAEKIKS